MRPVRDYPSFFYGWAAGSLATLGLAEIIAPGLVGRLFLVQWILIKIAFFKTFSFLFNLLGG